MHNVFKAEMGLHSNAIIDLALVISRAVLDNEYLQITVKE